MNYSKGDCRIGRNAPCFSGKHAMTIGPRAVRAPTTFGSKVDPEYTVGPPPYRKERRAIGAAFRAKYGKAEFQAMRDRNTGGRSSVALAKAMVDKINDDEKVKE